MSTVKYLELFDDRAKYKWAEVLPILQARGDDLDAGTLDALSCYASAWSQWTAAQAQVQQLGMIVKSPAGFAVADPYLAVAKDTQRQMRQWGDVLHIHKQPRQKAEEPAGQGNGLLRLLGGRGDVISIGRSVS